MSFSGLSCVHQNTKLFTFQYFCLFGRLQHWAQHHLCKLKQFLSIKAKKDKTAKHDGWYICLDYIINRWINQTSACPCPCTWTWTATPTTSPPTRPTWWTPLGWWSGSSVLVSLMSNWQWWAPVLQRCLIVSTKRIFQAADKMFDFEREVAMRMTPSSERRNSTAMYNPMTIAELKALMPNMDWDK